MNKNSHLCYSTLACEPGNRSSLIQDLAHAYFNLSVDLGSTCTNTMFADIQVFKGEVATRIDVSTSWSEVKRSSAQARASATDNLMVYWIRGEGSWFCNGLGKEFRASTGSVVVGAQDAVYQATALEGKPWGFRALSVSPSLLPRSRACIRDGGYQVVKTHAPLQRVLAAYLIALLDEIDAMESTESIAGLCALDHLLSMALTGVDTPSDGLDNAKSLLRYKSSLTFIRCNLHHPDLTPAQVAQSMCISERQLHRAFQASNTSVAAEVKRLRTEQAMYMLREFPLRPISDVAYQDRKSVV